MRNGVSYSSRSRLYRGHAAIAIFNRRSSRPCSCPVAASVDTGVSEFGSAALDADQLNQTPSHRVQIAGAFANAPIAAAEQKHLESL